jgi:uncharacterized OB-fold protein
MKKFMTCPECGKLARFPTTLCPHCGHDATKILQSGISEEVEAAAELLQHEDPVTWPDIPADLCD